MKYQIVKKQEEVAPESLYGVGAMRHKITLEHPQLNGTVDAMNSWLHVSKDVYDALLIGNCVEINIQVVIIEPEVAASDLDDIPW